MKKTREHALISDPLARRSGFRFVRNREMRDSASRMFRERLTRPGGKKTAASRPRETDRQTDRERERERERERDKKGGPTLYFCGVLRCTKSRRAAFHPPLPLPLSAGPWWWRPLSRNTADASTHTASFLDISIVGVAVHRRAPCTLVRVS